MTALVRRTGASTTRRGMGWAGDGRGILRRGSGVQAEGEVPRHALRGVDGSIQRRAQGQASRVTAKWVTESVWWPHPTTHPSPVVVAQVGGDGGVGRVHEAQRLRMAQQ